MKKIKKPNGKLPGWGVTLVIVFGVLYVLSLVGFGVLFWYLFSNNVFDEKDLEVYGDIEGKYITSENEYVVYGMLYNPNETDYYNVDVIYTLYDNDDRIIGEAEDEIDFIGSKNYVKFDASYDESGSKRVVKYELKSINGF